MQYEKRKLLKRILVYLKPFKNEFLLIGVTLVISTIVGFLQPLIVRTITDDGMMKSDLKVLIQAASTLAVTVLLSQAVELVQAKLFAVIHNQTFFTIFKQTFQKLLHLEKAYFEDKNNAEILSFLQTDVAQISSVTDRYTVMCIGYAFKIISGLIGLLLISWEMALIVLSVVPIKLLLVRFFANRNEETTEKMIEASRDFSRWYGDALGGIDEIKLWNLFQSKERIFKQKQEEVLRLQKKGIMISAWNMTGESILEWCITISLYILGGVLIYNKEITIGSVFAFVSYSAYVTGPISLLLNLKMYFARIFPSAKRLFMFLDMKEEIDAGRERIETKTPTIEFRNVGFQYEVDHPVLIDVSFIVKPGEKIAIIGQNGSGKSTILNLLLRFYELQRGEILVDGKDIRKINLAEYRNLFSVVSQEPYLFMGNILENIDMEGSVDRERIETALNDSGVADYLKKMPNGEKTQIGRNGARLSGGEKQKLAVARALLRNAPIIILDEATSNFDTESSEYLHDLIVHKMKDKSVLMITHHYEHLNDIDRVYRIDGGNLHVLK